MAAPKTANIEVTVGNTEYFITHSNFSKLTVKRTAKDVCDSFTLEILDTDAYEIETAVLSGENYIKVVYLDDDLEIHKTLAGFIYKMSSAFIDNRNMLTLTGFISSSIRDKFEKYSYSWNTVPKFNWKSVLGKAYSGIVDANYSGDSLLDQQWESDKASLSDVWQGIKSLFSFNLSGWDDYREVIDNIFEKDLISIDKQGNYYVQKYKDLKDNSAEYDDKMTGELSGDKEEDLISKQTGCYTIPIKPDKLLRLICCGGKFSDILEKEYSDYKGTAFYKEDISEAEWYFIKKWFERMGEFQGLGYSNFVCNYDLMWDQSEYNQTRQSFLEFMYNFVLGKCVQEKNGKRYTNFYLSFDEGGNNTKGTVKLGRIDASVQPTDIPQYIYYGKFKDSGKNKGRMLTFSPTLDILTSMITKGTYVDKNSGADISKTNLLGTTADSDITVSASDAISANEGRYNVKWGLVRIATSTSDTANKEIAENKIVSVFDKAESLAYKAECTIEGFNTLAPQDYIEILMLPRNDDGIARHHHLSGVYFILEVENTIDNGKFLTTLHLVKNIGNIGNTAVVEKTESDAIGEVKYTVTAKETSPDSILSASVKLNTGRQANL